MNVAKGSFRPIPKVDSAVIYLKPKDVKINERELFIIGLIMQHKKKTVYNAILDSSSYLEMDRKELAGICENVEHKTDRVFKLDPETILKVSAELDRLLK